MSHHHSSPLLPDSLAQPTILPLPPKCICCSPQHRPIFHGRVCMSPVSQCSHLTTDPTIACILGHGTWQRLPHLPPGWSGTFSRAGAVSVQVWVPCTWLRSTSKDTNITRLRVLPVLRAAERADPCSGVRGRPMGPEKSQDLQGQAPTSLKLTGTSLLLSQPCP